VAQAPKPVTVLGSQARERIAGEIRRRSRPECPEREIPREQPAFDGLIPRLRHGARQRVETQKPRPAGPARITATRASASVTAGKNGVTNGTWVHPRGNAADTVGEEQSSEGRIPGAPSGRNKPDPCVRRVNRREGSQTLWAERSRHGMPASRGSARAASAKGNQSP